MDSNLLDYYNRELAYLREMGAEFATRYPKVAGRLGMHGIEVADPYVERLMEGFAFLTSRVQLKMDAEFPRFSQRLLEMIAPSYLSPTPSMAIAQLTPDSRKGDITQGFRVPRGTMMESQNLKKTGVTCSYTTAHDVVLHPLRISEATLGGVPADLPSGELKLSGLGAASALRIRISCDGISALSQLNVSDLMLFLSGPDIQALKLLELLMQHRVGIVLQSVEKRPQRQILTDEALQQEGFAPEQALLPDDLRNFDGYRLLQEYFAFPARFQFISLGELAPFLRRCDSATAFDIIILLDKADSALESVVDSSHLALHCTPVINLFPKTAERLKVSDSQHEYHLVVDNIRPLDYEVHSVQRLFATVEGQREEQVFRPFWSTFSGDEGDYGAYFSLRREQRTLSDQAQRYGTRTGYIGSEVFLSLVDEHHAPWRDGVRYLSAEVMCTSRDLPLMLQQDQGNFVMPDSIPVAELKLCKGPTPPRPALAEGLSAWRLISHLQMNYLSLMDSREGEGAAALRQLLSSMRTSPTRRLPARSTASATVRSARLTRRVPEPGPVVFARGVSIRLEVDEQAFSGASPWLLGSVLERVCSRLVALNSFTEFTLNSQQRGEVGYWPPRMGRKALI
ncbi:type VI secretion system baseplate subunit TssF [Pantoea deleyi]|uniref:type VI secretion system baseplate subunit TssF n=1 Tax=Pantoea deleyi TaxID=470932 RepID=UPI000FE13FB7|nr:type VI secretion system baseplate subunit TssF [Pantoea deleyi]